MGIMNLSKQQIANAFKNGKEIRICVVGLGRIGLPTAAVLADAGAQVLGVDINPRVVDEVNLGKSPFKDEPGLDWLVERVTRDGRLKAGGNVSSAVAKSDVIIICVPTPINERKAPDYTAIITASRGISRTLKKGSLIVVESSVGPGTVENLIIPILEKKTGMKAGKDFGVASCPERANPGHILSNLKKVPRIIGGIDPQSTEVAVAIYQSALGIQIVKVRNPKTANAVKLTENVFRDVNIALMNELAFFYQKLDVDTIEVIDACATKWNFLPHYPGAGVGGGCLPTSSCYLIDEEARKECTMRLIRMAREINDEMPEHVVMLVEEALKDAGKVVRGSKIAILGVSYKPDVHDIQRTPIRHIYLRLKKMGASIAIYDPLFRGENVFGVKASKTLEEAVHRADCILIGTAHKDLRSLNLASLARISNMPTGLVDTSHVVEPAKVKEHGFSYRGIGKILS